MKSLIYNILKKPIIPRISLSNFALNLFLFNCIFDPGNALFHTKQITFFFALVTNIKKMTCKNYFPLFNFLIFYVAFFESASLMMLRNIDYDSSFVNMYSTTFLLLIIFFINNDKIEIHYGFNTVCFVIAMITIVLSFIIINVPVLSLVVLENKKLNTIFMMAEHKKFLWWWFSSVFHMASPLLIIQVALKFYSFLQTKKIKEFLKTAFYFIAMFFTATRANVFAEILVIGLIYLYYLFYKKKKIYSATFLCLIFIAFAFIGTFLLLTVKNSSSNMKDMHMVSYNVLFSENPSYILLGQGPGAWLYDFGWKKLCTNTELSYMELIRMFGLVFTIAIMCLYAYPFLHFMKKPNFFSFSISIAYLAYFFIAGTNPLLIGPTGFIAFWYVNYLLDRGDSHA